MNKVVCATIDMFLYLAHTKKCQGTGGADVKTFPCDVCEKLFLSNRERVLHICNRETQACLNYFYASFTIVRSIFLMIRSILVYFGFSEN